MVRIDSIKCTGCGYCVDVCPQQAITIDNDVAVVNQELCVQCGTCVEICPANAIHEVVPAYARLAKGGERMLFGRGWFSWRSRGRGFGFRGASPPWPYVGRGRGGLPRCWYPGAFIGSGYASGFYSGYPAWGAMPYPPQATTEQEMDFLREEANAVRSQLEDIETRITELEAKEG